jgi:hypothetical protein
MRGGWLAGVVRAARAINWRENRKARVVGFVSSVNPEASKCRAGVNRIATRFFTKLLGDPVNTRRARVRRVSRLGTRMTGPRALSPQGLTCQTESLPSPTWPNTTANLTMRTEAVSEQHYWTVCAATVRKKG